jgi:hypothetical protein
VLLALLAELLLLLGLDIGRRYVRIVRIVLRSALG